MTDESSIANDYSGEANAVMQAGSIHGDVYLSSTRRRFTPPRQLPLAPSSFVNRRDDIDRLDELLDAPSSAEHEYRSTAVVSAVAGAPGVGKTAWTENASSYSLIMPHHLPRSVIYFRLRLSAAPLSPAGVHFQVW